MSARAWILVGVGAAMTMAGWQCAEKRETRCAAASDCGTGETCLVNGFCAATCAADAECGDGQRCSNAGGCIDDDAQACGADADCQASQVCHQTALCGAACSATSCEPGYACNTGNGRCTAQGNSPTSCGGELFQARRTDATFLITLDGSGSMKDDDERISGRYKWDIANDVLDATTPKVESKLSLGLSLFPVGECGAGQVKVSPALNQAQEIAAATPAEAMGGKTPIAATLLAMANVPALQDPSRANYVLLVTDGKETCYGDPLAGVRALRAKEIRTYVVGFGSEVDPVSLSRMAELGGTARSGPVKYYQADDQAGLDAALEAATKGALGCDFKLAKAPPNPDKIFVYVNGVQVPRDPGQTNGWDYANGYERIVLYGSACEPVTKDANAKVHLVYGCPDGSLTGVPGAGSGSGSGTPGTGPGTGGTPGSSPDGGTVGGFPETPGSGGGTPDGGTTGGVPGGAGTGSGGADGGTNPFPETPGTGTPSDGGTTPGGSDGVIF